MSAGWTKLSISQNFKCICTSENGTIAYFGNTDTHKIYKTVDNGNTFTKIYDVYPNRIYSVCCSSDGLTMYAGIGVYDGGGNFNSLGCVIINLSGTTYKLITTTSQSQLATVACSHDGTKVGFIYSSSSRTPQLPYYSTDSGSIFSVGIGAMTGTSNNECQNLFVCNEDGTKMYSTTSDGIFKSTDSCSSFSKIYSSANLSSVACTSDGNRIFTYNSTTKYFYALDPSGNELYSTYNAYGMNFISCSYNGLKLITATPTFGSDFSNGATISNDGGVNNTEQSIPGTGENFINGIASNSTGTTVYVINNLYNQVYQYIQPGTCLMENSKITSISGEINIQDLKKGDLIKTHTGKYVPVSHLGYSTINFNDNNNAFEIRMVPKNAFLNNLPSEDVYLTRMHSLLFKPSETQNYTNNFYLEYTNYYDNAIKIEGYDKVLAVHCNKCKYPYFNSLKEKYGELGKYYHIVLLDKDSNKEYGIYTSGLLVESCSKSWFDRSELNRLF